MLVPLQPAPIKRPYYLLNMLNDRAYNGTPRFIRFAMIGKVKLIFLCILSGFLLVSCDSGGGLLDKINDFDQGPMLENIGNHLILPAYEDLKVQTAHLQSSIDALTTAPTSEALSESRTALKEARRSWQYCSPYRFGPAEALALAGVLNIYPIDVLQIERNLEEGSYDLSKLSNADARGFQTLGYFLHRPEMTDEEVLNALTADVQGYMQAVASEIAETSAAVYEQWSAEGGNYIATFTSEDAYGVNVGSSVGKMVNALNLDFERNTRDGKIGIPAGVRSLGEPILTATEAYYAAYSVELFGESIAAYYQLYTGGEGIGLDDYLQAIEATTTSNEDLSKKIDAQFKTIQSVALTDPLTEQISTDNTTVLQVFAEMQQLIVMLKTDMASSIGVVITYQDNDGD